MISTYSVIIFRNLVNQLSLKSAPKNVIIRTSNLRWCSQTITSKMKMCRKPDQEENIKKVVKLMSEYPTAKSIKWEEIEERFNQLGLQEQEPHSTVLQACLRLRNLEAGISYFNHVTENGKDFKAVDLVFFLKLFKTQEDIKKYDTLVKHIYDKIEVYLSSSVIQDYLLKLISEIPVCFYTLAKSICEGKKTFLGSNLLVQKAFELKNGEIALELLKVSNPNINCIFTYYIDYLCHLVVENKFSVDMITTLFKLCEDNNNFISRKNYSYFSNIFFKTLKQYEKNYEWTLNTCNISDSSICSNCGKKLIDKCISESDFELLKKAFFPKAGLTDKNIFLNSSDQELIRFFKFLNSSKPYQIVVDALNLLYKNKTTSNFLSRPIKYFLDKEMNVLIISRKHAKKQILKMSFLKKQSYKNRCQFFFTENLSDDDLFTLYATLHGGLGTYFISGDFLLKYGTRFDNSLQKIYYKWKSYHQFVFNTDVISPLPSLGMSQLTSDENGQKFTWHISNIREKYMSNQLSPVFQIQWACLQATKKNS